MVPRVRLELTRLSALASKTSVATNYTTEAFANLLILKVLDALKSALRLWTTMLTQTLSGPSLYTQLYSSPDGLQLRAKLCFLFMEYNRFPNFENFVAASGAPDIKINWANSSACWYSDCHEYRMVATPNIQNF